MDAQEHGWLFLPGLFSLAKAKQRTCTDGFDGALLVALWIFFSLWRPEFPVELSNPEFIAGARGEGKDPFERGQPC